MVREFKLPELGENVESGDVAKVLVSPGDTLEKDQPVLELETDKAVVEIPSTVSGKIKELKVEIGDQVAIGQVILTLEEGEEDIQEEAPAAKEEAKPEQDDKPSEKNAAVTGGQQPAPKVSRMEAREERGIKRDEITAAPETTVSAPAPATPSVRRLARELGVDIHEVTGSGPGGRISGDDVKHYVRALVSQRTTPSSAPGVVSQATPFLPLPAFEKWGAVEREPMSKIRRKTAEQMSQAWTIPHVTQHDQADITRLEQARKRLARRVEQAGGKLTLTAIALKVVAAALRAFPRFNTSIDVDAKELVYKQYCHIGVAVDAEHGLLVPVLREVDQKNIAQLAVELTELAEKARSRKIGPEEMAGGSFTITNLGGLGGSYFTPIINWPEVAILGLSRAKLTPLYREGELQPRLLLPLSLSYDHRVIDGADAVRFLRWIAEALEDPLLLSLEG
ncbi:2-oxo acid dehydrogenase subunit E2 [Nitrosococcus watsonii]|uniref:Dihydrolipoamide acetyltransferase component of pyruvate dehydrogenase complex n=1 Tax=Nitrosococcus watsoni (strain C-113) TaxID=105559 RepID=D8K5A0_NITWC|nr:2-oxo acid dehydrogenase subunit E2 [Nitrosococcus watsonii]ADJ28077.1 catalytic domain of components of various dehydrogenase complexes [Nitrosococcus watsonii C-113]